MGGEEEEDGERTKDDDGGEMGWEEPGGMHQYSSEDERVEIIHQGKWGNTHFHARLGCFHRRILQPFQVECLFGDVLGNQDEPRFPNIRSKLVHPFNMVARKWRVGHQDIEFGGAASSAGSIKVFVPVNHVVKPQRFHQCDCTRTVVKGACCKSRVASGAAGAEAYPAAAREGFVAYHGRHNGASLCSRLAWQ